MSGRPDSAYCRPVADGGTAGQSAAAATGYLAYSGPNWVDGSTGYVHHQVVAPRLPNWLAHSQLRHGRLDGEQLTLSAETTRPNSTAMISIVVRARALLTPSRPESETAGNERD